MSPIFMETQGISQEQLQKTKLELEESKSRYHSVIESAHDAIISADSNGIIIDWNSGAARMFGYEATEMIGKPLTQIMPQRYREAHTKGIERFRSTGKAAIAGKILELHGLRKDGTEFPLELTVSDWKADGKTFATGILRDISKRKAIEEELWTIKNRYYFLVEAIRDYAIFMIDPKGHVMSWNPGAERINGYTEAEILGKHFSIFYTEEDRKAGRPQNLLETAKTQGRVEDKEWRVRKDGSKFLADVILSPMHDEHGTLFGFAKVTRDMTEQIKIDHMKSDLIGFASHQLKTPLAQLYGYVENMLSGLTGKLNNKQKQYLDSMREICLEHLELISSLLNVSKLESGMLETQKHPVALEEAVLPTLEFYRERIKRKGLKLEVKTENEHVTVLADLQKLTESVKNVLDNAIKFTDHGSITIRLKESGNMGIVEIIDTGEGMDEKILKQLFTKEPFLSETRDSRSGSGLGLYIAKNFMKLQGGDIAAETIPGKGSRFILSIPKTSARRIHAPRA